MELLKAAMAVLKPFERATTEISADISNAFQSQRLYLLLSPPAFDLVKYLQTYNLASAIKAQLRHHFTGVESVNFLALSTLLDPRMKKLAFFSLVTA